MTVDTALQYTFTGSLTKTDSKTYHPYTFEVPEGITNIHINFTYSPAYATGRIHRNQLNVSLDDPDGIRGVWNVIRPEGFDVNGVLSSRGFGSWPIQPGTWTAYVDSHRILPPDTVTYELTVTLSSDPVTVEPSPWEDVRKVASTQPGWYRGDLHGHTFHSDGSWDIPEFTAYMRGRGLDFVTLSDHNVPTGLAQHRNQTEDGFLAMGGMELSTFNGHMLALGTSNWYEWRLNIREGVTVHTIMQAALDSGAMLIIAHPMSPDEPFCSGCIWGFEDARPGVALGVEVWNGEWHVFNEEGLQQYYVWLNQGHRLVATSGSDIHSRPDENRRPGRAGANVVYATELSEAAILAAIRQGHSYVSGGPELLLNAKTESGAEGMMGDLLPAENADLHIRWSAAHEGDILRVIADGQAVETRPAGEAGEFTYKVEAGQAKWIAVELRDAFGGLWAVTNPVFFGDWS
ncbi:MAG: CehA/McbA family metallohydrolase [Anaerolineae bacterium]